MQVVDARPGAAFPDAPAGRDRAAPPPRRPWSRDATIMVVLTGVSVAFCLFDLGGRSLWDDEFYSMFHANGTGSLWAAISANGGNMLAYYALLHGWVAVAGSSPLVLRLPSALAGAALAPVAFLLGRRAGGTVGGTVAGLLAAVSPPLVVWAQQARSFSFAVLGVAVMWLLALRVRERPCASRYLAFCVAASVTSYFLLMSVFFFTAALLWLLVTSEGPRERLNVMGCAGGFAVLCVPLAWLATRPGASSILSWVGAPSLSATRGLFEQTFGGAVPDFFFPRAANLVLAGVSVMTLAVGGWFGARGGVPRMRTMVGSNVGSFVFWLVVPVVMAWLYSVDTGHSVFTTSVLQASVTPGLLLVAAAVAGMRWRLLQLASIAAAVACSLLVLVPAYGVPDESWTGAAAIVAGRAAPGDCIAFDQPGGVSELAYYLSGSEQRGSLPQPIFPEQSWAAALRRGGQPAPASEAYSPEQVAAAVRSCNRLWLIVNRARQDLAFASGMVQTAFRKEMGSERHWGPPGIDVYLFVLGTPPSLSTRPGSIPAS